MIEVQDNFSKRILLYMDVLGFKNILRSNPKKLSEFIDFCCSNNRQFKIGYVPNGEFYDFKDLNPEISNFSDHIVVSYPVDLGEAFTSESALLLLITSISRIAVQIHRRALEQKLLVRGALTIGNLCHKGNKFLGEAALSAIEIEENIAVYPRTLIDNKLMYVLKKNNSFGAGSLRIEQDFDGMFFINYLKHPDFVGMGQQLRTPLLTIGKIINESLKTPTSQRVLSKWLWLANKYNDALDFFVNKNCIEAGEIIQKLELNEEVVI